MNHLVSIITPTYNSEHYIDRTIKSILAQTYRNWELLITDDCSNDKTVEIVQSYIKIDDRIKLFQLRENSGSGIARNNSIIKAQGRFIAFCDSDDCWLPKKLEFQTNFMLNNNLGFTYSSYFLVDENQVDIGRVEARKQITYRDILKNNYIGCLTAIYDTELVGKPLMPDIRIRQDWVLWIKILEKLQVAQGIIKPLAIYTKRSNSISSNKLKLIKYNWEVYHKTLGFSILKSLLCMVKFLFFYARKKITN